MPLELESFDFQVIKVNETGKIIKEESRQARQYTEILPQEVELEMVYIPGGTFMMGAPEDEEGSRIDEKPQVQITLEPFFIAKYPITQEQWRAIASTSQIDIQLRTAPSWFSRQRDSARRPVEQVNWHEALEFCKRLSRKTGREYNLPSEEQWEYACRAGTTTAFHFGETITITNRFGCDRELLNLDFHINETTRVGQFPPNAFGLYDMHGNVWEWCYNNYRNRNHNPCIRGGSWGTPRQDCRSASRLDEDSPEDRNSYKGFRVICNVPAGTTEKVERQM